MHGTGGLSSRDDGLVFALTGGEDFSHEDGWFFAPPIFSFSSRRKRENGPCTVQKRKRSNGDDTGARKRCRLFYYASLQSAA